jgi:hypothetical protein
MFAQKRKFRIFFLISIALLLIPCTVSAAPLTFTVNASEPVTVTGTPRLVLDIGGVTRYADYASGSGTDTLLFTYNVQAGDFDANGISVASPIDLNGGTIRDAGNNDLELTYAPPAMPNVRVQTYTAAYTTNPITNTNANNIAFVIHKAPNGSTFDYTITSDGGAGSVTGSGTISGDPHAVSGVNVSALPSGVLTLSVTITTAAGGTGTARTAAITPTFTGLLDSLPASSAAYSTRRLRSAHNTALLRVRRSSDSTEQDIGFTVAGDLNVSALSTFCGAGSCFIRTWYDQSGNGLNANQTVFPNQPTIFNTGSVVQISTRPSVQWNTTANVMNVNGLNWNAYTISTVIRHDNLAGPVRALLTKRSSVAASEFFWFTFNINSGNITWDQSPSGANRYNTGFLPAINTNYIYTLVRPLTGTNRVQYVNGVVQGSTAANPDIVNTHILSIGNDPGAVDRGAGYRMGELIIFNSALSNADRTTKEANQGSYYGIP